MEAFCQALCLIYHHLETCSFDLSGSEEFFFFTLKPQKCENITVESI